MDDAPTTAATRPEERQRTGATDSAPSGPSRPPAWPALIAVAVPAVAALLAAGLTPRGPLTTADALVSMVAALAVGVLTGALVGSRWS